MGIRFYCPKGHKLNVKAELAGKIGFCPECGERMMIPFESTRESSHKKKQAETAEPALMPVDPDESISAVTLPSAPELPSNEEEVSVKIHQPEKVAVVSDAPIQPVQTAEVPDHLPPEPVSVSSIDSNPLLSDSNLVWYTRGTDNQSYGPVTNVVMASWLKERRIGPTMLVWREGWTSWLEAKNVFPELEAIFTSAPAPAVQENLSPMETPPAVPVPPAVEPAAEPAAPVVSDTAPFQLDESVSYEIERKKAAAQRRKKKQNQELALVIGLIVVIVTLLCVLIFILVRQNRPASAPASSRPAASAEAVPSAPPAEVAP